MLREQFACADGSTSTKLDQAIARLKMFEPPEGYYVAFSGGKDSQCIYHLCQQAGVKFDAHYRCTSVDPPELVRFIRERYPDVEFDYPRDENGKRITMWNLIPKKLMPPTRIVRYCCEELKESGGKDRVTVTGVRWAESNNRRKNRGVVNIQGKPKNTIKTAEELGADYTQNSKNGITLNLDNDPTRQLVEHCYRNRKVIVNPIVDWDDEEVWEYLNEIVKVPHCCLYDEGEKRIGCIGCPLCGGKRQKHDLRRWKTYKRAYLTAFEKMLGERKKKGMETSWETPEEVMAWWLGEPDDTDYDWLLEQEY